MSLPSFVSFVTGHSGRSLMVTSHRSVRIASHFTPHRNKSELRWIISHIRTVLSAFIKRVAGDDLQFRRRQPVELNGQVFFKSLKMSHPLAK